MNIMFQQDKMYVQCLDTSLILILEIELPNTWFDVYELVNETSVTVGVQSLIWSKVLTMRDKSQTIYICTDDEEDKLLISFQTTSDNKGKVFDKHFEIPLLDIDSDIMNIPSMEYQAEFSLLSATFANMISQLKQFGDTIDIECSEEAIKMVSQSVENGKMNANMPIDGLNEYSIEENKVVRSCFSLKHLHNICQYHKIANSVQLYLSENYPIKIKYEIEGNGHIVFYLAPREE